MHNRKKKVIFSATIEYLIFFTINFFIFSFTKNTIDFPRRYWVVKSSIKWTIYSCINYLDLIFIYIADIVEKKLSEYKILSTRLSNIKLLKTFSSNNERFFFNIFCEWINFSRIQKSTNKKKISRRNEF